MFDLPASLVEHHKELLSGHGDFVPDPVQILKLGDPDRGSARSQWFPEFKTQRLDFFPWPDVNRIALAGFTAKDGDFLGGPSMTTTHTYHYRGYEIVPQRQWASWCASIHATRAELPLLSRSALRTLAPRKEAAVAEAKHSIDEALARE